MQKNDSVMGYQAEEEAEIESEFWKRPFLTGLGSHHACAHFMEKDSSCSCMCAI